MAAAGEQRKRARRPSLAAGWGSRIVGRGLSVWLITDRKNEGRWLWRARNGGRCEH